MSSVTQICKDAYDRGDLKEARTLVFQALNQAADHNSIQILCGIVVNRDNDGYFQKSFLEALLKKGIFRIGALHKLASSEEKLLRKIILKDIGPVAKLALSFLSKGAQITAIDGGATGSKMYEEFDGWPNDRWLVVGFDPSDSAVLDSDQNSNLEMHRVALSDRVGTSLLYETRIGGASSFFAPNKEYLKDWSKFHSDGLEVVDTHEVETVTLDSLFEGDTRTIDYIKLNVQGAELAILKGASSHLNSTMGIQLEVSFVDHYSNTPGFGDIDRFMRTNGFILFDIRKTNHVQRKRRRTASATNFGPRTADFSWPTTQVYEAIVLYLRDPFHPSEANNPIWQKRDSWLKLAVIAEIQGQLDFAIQLLEKVEADPSLVSGDALTAFTQQLDKVYEVYEAINVRHY